MKHLNYFQPYTKGTEFHEDHLTRAFLSLLRLSNTALQDFYGYVYDKLALLDNQPLTVPYQMKFSEINFQTQVGSLPLADGYVSLLITNDPITIDLDIVPVERTAVYDGIIQFEENLVFFIETKPEKGNVWQGQLCPAQKDIPADAALFHRPAILEWKIIINSLHQLNDNPYTSLIERILIGDFFAFVNEKFDYLNPYNDLSKCHSSYLAKRRIEQILMEIAFDEEKVAMHLGWGFHLQLDFPEIKKLALLLNVDNEDHDEWTSLTIAADFGSTVSQARHLYTNLSNYAGFEAFPDWSTYCNLHLAFKSKNLVFISSPEGVNERYFNYWKSDVQTNFGGKPKRILLDEIAEYQTEGIINYSTEKQLEVQLKIINKGYQNINICPALYQEYYSSKSDAIAMDAAGKLAPFLRERMHEVLLKLGHPLDRVFK